MTDTEWPDEETAEADRLTTEDLNFLFDNGRPARLLRSQTAPIPKRRVPLNEWLYGWLYRWFWHGKINRTPRGW